MVNSLTISQGMLILDEAFSKTRKIMQGYPGVKFTAEEYQRYYECVYLLCVQRTSSENARILYERYKNGLEECINSLILPALEDKSGAALLTELMLKWSGYQVFARWLSRFFEYLDRFYVPRVEGFRLLDLAVKCFDDLVNARLNTKFVTAAISLVCYLNNFVRAIVVSYANTLSISKQNKTRRKRRKETLFSLRQKCNKAPSS